MPTPLSQTYGKQAPKIKTVTELQLEVTRITGIWPRKVFIQWLIRNPVAASGYTFSVYRAASPNGPWETLDNTLADTYFYVDDTFTSPTDQTSSGLFSMRQALYYKVEVDHEDLTAPISIVKQFEAGLDRRRASIARKLRRDVNVMLRKGSGTEVAILKRRWWGEQCDCKTKTGQITRSHCRTCFGTGIIGGYWDPVYSFAVRSASPVDERTSVEGNVETHYLQVLMSYLPEVAPKDVLVFMRDNKRYIIDSVQTTEIHTVNIHQELQVSELARSSREYDVIVDNWHDPEWF